MNCEVGNSHIIITSSEMEPCDRYDTFFKIIYTAFLVWLFCLFVALLESLIKGEEK